MDVKGFGRRGLNEQFANYRGYDAFSNCRLLAKLELPLSVKEIRDDALHNSKSLVQVKLPHGLKWMGERTLAWSNKINKTRNMQLVFLARHTSRIIENKMIENKRDDKMAVISFLVVLV